MKRSTRNLDAINANVWTLLEQRRALETQALGAEIPEEERRARYLGIADPEQRRQLIHIARELHGLRASQRAASVEYYTEKVEDTRAKLADLTSTSLLSGWRRAIWLDIFTTLWIVAGAGWLALGLWGGLAGAVITAAGSRFIVRAREPTRRKAVIQGESLLRSASSELDTAREAIVRAAQSSPPFSAEEEAGGSAAAQPR